ncbi:MAG: AsmA family protein [Candidatus Omnitrophota bacterium]
MKMIKKLVFVFGIIFLVLAVISLASFAVIKHLKIGEIVEKQIEQSLGIDVSIEKIKFSPLLAHIGLSGITIYNPAGFEEKELAYIEAIHFVCDPIEIITSKKPNIYVLGLNLKRLNIMKNKEGKVNLEEINPLKNGDAAIQDKTPFYFDMLVLSVGQVRFVDYSGPNKKEHVYPIGIKNAAFINLTNEQDVVRMVVSKAIENTDIGKLINLKIIPVVSQIGDTFNSAWGTAKTGAKGVWGIAILPFNLLFGKN